MQCTKYPDRQASGVCSYSGKPYCAEELVEIQGKMYAKDNLNSVIAEIKDSGKEAGTKNPLIFMNAGGGAGGGGGGGAASSSSAAAVDPAVSAPVLTPVWVCDKSRSSAIWITLFLGAFGGTRFYLGQTARGIFSLLFCWTFIPALAASIEIWIFAFMSDEAFARKYGKQVMLPRP